METQLARVGKEDQIQRMRKSLDDLAATLDPINCTSLFPPIFCNIFQLLTTALLAASGIHRFAECLPRGHGKTIVMKMILYWAIVFSSKRFIVVVCASEGLAENLVADVWDMIWSPNSVALFGEPEVETDRGLLKKFKFRDRDIVIRAQGVGTAIRGLNIKNVRPDLFLCDDMQTKEDAASVPLAIQTQKWFVGTLLKAGAPLGYTVIYLGNMYPDIKIPGNVIRYTCIMRNLQLNPRWTTWVVGAILESGEALWPEVRSLRSLFDELEMDMSMGEESTFYAEVLNDPNASANGVWDSSKIKQPHSEIFESEQPLGRFIILDPSCGRKKSDDQVAILCEYWDEVPEVVDLRILQLSGPATVHALVAWMVETNCRLLCAESVAYQSVILQWFDYVCQQLGVEGLVAVPLMPKGRSKNSRIVSAFKSVMAGNISLGMKVRSFLYLQAKQFQITRIDNKDDGWDCVAYVEEANQEYADLSLVPLEAARLPGVDNIWEVVEERGHGIDLSGLGIDFNG